MDLLENGAQAEGAEVNEGSTVPKPAAGPLSTAEREIVNLFIQVARVVGLPRSAAEIYGGLFVSPEPLAYEEIMDRVSLSAGSASHGLRLLRAIGAVSTVYVPGDRRDHYSASSGPGVTSGLIRHYLEQHMLYNEEQLARIFGLLEQTPHNGEHAPSFLRSRVLALREWLEETRAILPLALDLFKRGTTKLPGTCGGARETCEG